MKLIITMSDHTETQISEVKPGRKKEEILGEPGMAAFVCLGKAEV